MSHTSRNILIAAATAVAVAVVALLVKRRPSTP
jgi:hypothetical protein